jgi:predicted dinucleotide-binding enzyme
MTTIAIIGTGLMSNALGAGWTRAGHQVRVGARSPEKAAGLGFTPSFAGTHREALAGSDVVVLAIPFPAVADFVPEHRDQLDGRVIIDISNPFDNLPNNERAGAEYTADLLGTTTGLVAAFKDNFAATINDSAAADGVAAQVKIAADDEEAKAVVVGLVHDLNLRVLDCGELHNARFLDGMVSLMLILDRAHAGFTMHTGWAFTGLENKR